jgi:hypothetical protein
MESKVYGYGLDISAAIGLQQCASALALNCKTPLLPRSSVRNETLNNVIDNGANMIIGWEANTDWKPGSTLPYQRLDASPFGILQLYLAAQR